MNKSQVVSVLAVLVVLVAGWYLLFNDSSRNSSSSSSSKSHPSSHKSSAEEEEKTSTSSSLKPTYCNDIQNEKNLLEGLGMLLKARVYDVAGRNENVFKDHGNIGEAMPEFHYFFSVTKNRTWIKVMCEIGFNAGHSALALLMGNPRARYIAFDALYLKWTQPMIQFLQTSFPNRIELVPGPSIDTVPRYRPDGFPGCDLISIDGRHFDPEAYW